MSDQAETMTRDDLQRFAAAFAQQFGDRAIPIADEAAAQSKGKTRQSWQAIRSALGQWMRERAFIEQARNS